MTIFFLLAPFSVLLALLGLWGFWWTVRSGQYDDPAGDAARILIDDDDAGPPALIQVRAREVDPG
ncbi:cbb3-type cytochrome oxidase assembly protein CcoS [soil metagenome]|uniref:Cbb3-type cytochrome oxidase assembly protein CcoS n=1 Tax=Phenylobacterium glaciei TaxID=2803784 RepID=A0A941HW87_9CAUL|nr:cbb3-type cytochrome oxidase assembly protein CcoS [Phenylobacterium glaciei]MBR7620629.1 cbb3-type cytochrome oxidase assembly protein CcoS [Phenylobacterium glaciei]